MTQQLPGATMTPVPGMPFLAPEFVFQVVVKNAVPRPQGSKVSFKAKNSKKIVTLEDGKERLDAWRNAVQAAVLQTRGRPRVAIDNPVALAILFTLPRPKSAPKTAHTWPDTRATGDLDKLQRATFDALVMGKVMADDSLVVGVSAWSVYAGHPAALPCPGAVIDVYELPPRIPHTLCGTGTLEESTAG